MKIVNKKLISVSESDIVDGKFINKTVTEVGDDCFVNLKSLRSVSLPKVNKIGSRNFSDNAALTSVSVCKKILNTKTVDGFCFVITAEKTSKDIKILTGYNLVKIRQGAIINDVCFVAEKDGFTAHGETVKRAISDLQFKIVADKLKKEPIEADTIITIKHYRLITGACEFGVNSWMQQVFIEKERAKIADKGIKASDLLPLLKKNSAYGLDRFQSLITF